MFSCFPPSYILCGTRPCCLLQPSLYLEPRLRLAGDVVVEAETLILSDLLPGHLFPDVWALLASWLPESWDSCGWAHLISTEPYSVALGAACFNTYAFPALPGSLLPSETWGHPAADLCCPVTHDSQTTPELLSQVQHHQLIRAESTLWAEAEVYLSPPFSRSCLPTPPIPASLLSGSTPAMGPPSLDLQLWGHSLHSVPFNLDLLLHYTGYCLWPAIACPIIHSWRDSDTS